MKTFVFDAILMILALWYCGFINISLNPFSITFPGWHYVLGMQLFAFGQYRIGYENGNDAAMETFHRVLSERAKAANEEQP